ncbi:GumC family protein [Alistipes sp.]|uniref:GumC family protein n=1 Tax=Alistipes sp. TaxID=1872444 RepID=UPI003AF19D7B
MNYLAYVIKFLYRIKWWLILCPLLVALAVYLKMGKMPRYYKSSMTIYTGVVSGYDIESSGGTRQDWNIINNAMDNLMNILTSQATLKNVSLRLFVQDLVHGDPQQDNQYLLAKTYRRLLQRTPPDVMALVDRDDENKTLEQITAYETNDRDNHVYGLFMWNHPHYSYQALSRIKVKRVGSSDMLEITYENDDPGIVYQTLLLLNDEFVKQYKELRFGETNNVIDYFQQELNRVGNDLKQMEDSLLEYNIRHQVINYDEQTKHIASLSRDYDLRTEDIELNYQSAKRLRQAIEEQLDGLKTFHNNARFLAKLRQIGALQTRISAAEAFNRETETATEGEQSADLTAGQTAAYRPQSRTDIDALRRELNGHTDELKQITTDIANQQYTKEGLSTGSMIAQWLDAVLLEEKSKTEMEVMKSRKHDLDNRYTLFSPVGSTLKRKNRQIGFSEQSYLSILNALNTARLRQKNLQMSSATLRIINPPVLPISAEPSKRKMMVFAAFAVTLVFVLGFFILLELIDRTLRDKIRTERITGSKVLGAFPGPGRLGERRYTKTYRQLAARQIGNAALNFFTPGRTNIVNLLSTAAGDGKTTLAGSLAEHFRESGMKVRVVTWNRDFGIDRKEYLLAERLSDFVQERDGEPTLAEAELVLVEYPALAVCSVPKGLLQEAALNLMIAPANRTWKDTDQLLFEKAVELAAPAPVLICLNCAQRSVVQVFTGLMPPFTFLRRLGYQISQFGFTAVK